MCKDWVIVFQNLKSGNVSVDVFTERDASKARKCFWACYRHDDCRILTVVEKPEIESGVATV